MTEAEARQILERLLSVDILVGNEKEAVDTAIKALEKQIAKNPKITSKVEDVEYMRCPDCQLTTVLYNGMRPLYCPNCGQKLDWSEV